MTQESSERLQRMRDAMPARPMSRRVLLRSAAVMPLMAAACKTWETPSRENLDALAHCGPVPAAEISYVRTQADSHVPGTDLNRLETVVRVLYKHFCLGVKDVRIPAGLKLVEEAYKIPNTAAGMMTGMIIAQNVKKGLFEPLGEHYQTNVCAYICGHKAALRALDQGRCEINLDDFKEARKETEREMRAKLACARSLSGNAGAPGLGGGC